MPFKLLPAVFGRFYKKLLFIKNIFPSKTLLSVFLQILFVATFFIISQPVNAKEERLIQANFNKKTDKLGFRWDINSAGSIRDGSNDCFDTGLRLRINGSEFNGDKNMMTPNGTEYVLSSNNANYNMAKNLNVTRRIFLDMARGGARYLDIIKNNSKHLQTINLENYTSLGGSCQFAIASDGKPFQGGKLGKKQIGFATISQSRNSRPSVIFLVAAANSKVKPLIQINSNRQVKFTFNNVKIKPGKTVVIGYWVLQRKNLTAANIGKAIAPFYKQRYIKPNIPKKIKKYLLNMKMLNPAEEMMESLVQPMINLADECGVFPDEKGRAILWLGQDEKLVGKLSMKGLSIKTAYGKCEVAADQVGIIVGGAGVNRPMRVFLRNGEIIEGVIEGKDMVFQPESYSNPLPLVPERMNILFTGNFLKPYVKTPEAMTFLQTNDGNRLLVSDPNLVVFNVATPWGIFTLNGGKLDYLLVVRDPVPQYRIGLKSGARFNAMMLKRGIMVDTLRFGKVELTTDRIKSWHLLDLKKKDQVGVLERLETYELRNGQVLLPGDSIFDAELDMDKLNIVTPLGVNAQNGKDILEIERLDSEGTYPKFAVRVSNGTKYEGSFAHPFLSFKYGKRTWRFPVQHVRHYRSSAIVVKKEPDAETEEVKEKPKNDGDLEEVDDFLTID